MPLTPTVDDNTAARLRRRLADQLADGGWLRADVWRSAVESVPRHVFLPAFYRGVDMPHETVWEPVSAATVGTESWLDMVYQNITWVTQLDSVPTDWATAQPVPGGDPTSSSSLPSLVVEMLEALAVEEGHRVLEIGTGTGYSTALLCHRLGADHITSIEVDPNVGAQAHKAIHAVGYDPTLVIGDGLDGYAANAPYDRIIATCAVRNIPASWLTQCATGGTILATISGWLYGSALARLEKTGEHTAHGTFLAGTISFMLARPQAAPVLGDIWDYLDQTGDERRTSLAPDILSDWTGRFVAQLAVPNAIEQTISFPDGRTVHALIDPSTEATAQLTQDANGQWTVLQTGPERIWDAIEDAILRWRSAGSPWIDKFAIHITPHEQTVQLNDGDTAVSGRLPSKSPDPPVEGHEALT